MICGLVLLAAAIAAPPAGAAPRPLVTVSVVAGIPGVWTDVYVNGTRKLRRVAPGTTTVPMRFAPGVHTVAVRASEASPALPAPVTQTMILTERTSATVVAHVDAARRPMLTFFENHVVPLRRRQTHIVFRQTAAAPPVDVLLDGRELFRYVAAPGQRAAKAAAGRHAITIREHGTDRVLWGPDTVTLRAGTSYALYAIGSAEDGTLVEVVQPLSGNGIVCGPRVPGCAAPRGARRPGTSPGPLWRAYPLDETRGRRARASAGGTAAPPAAATPTAPAEGRSTGATGPTATTGGAEQEATRAAPVPAERAPREDRSGRAPVWWLVPLAALALGVTLAVWRRLARGPSGPRGFHRRPQH